MSLKILLAGAGFALLASTAHAQSPSPAPPATSSVTPAGSKEYQEIRAARVTMVQAIEIAERTGAGGRAIAVEFETRDGNEPAHYEIKIMSGEGRVVEHEIDANSGQVLKSADQPIERWFTRLKPGALENARVSLRDAIGLAEGQAGTDARAIEAEIEREGETVGYEIEVATASGTAEFKVTSDGQVRRD